MAQRKTATAVAQSYETVGGKRTKLFASSEAANVACELWRDYRKGPLGQAVKMLGRRVFHYGSAEIELNKLAQVQKTLAERLVDANEVSTETMQ
tara:strand:+ start:1722 stop:2003 length:282 start_codon:yes stop_codon:yes gene_type:complete